jgi:hypothetical protein
VLIHPVFKGKGNQKESGKYRGILLLPVLGNIYSGIISRRVRDCGYFIVRKLPSLRWDLVKEEGQ